MYVSSPEKDRDAREIELLLDSLWIINKDVQKLLFPEIEIQMGF